MNELIEFESAEELRLRIRDIPSLEDAVVVGRLDRVMTEGLKPRRGLWVHGAVVEASTFSVDFFEAPRSLLQTPVSAVELLRSDSRVVERLLDAVTSRVETLARVTAQDPAAVGATVKVAFFGGITVGVVHGLNGEEVAAFCDVAAVADTGTLRAPCPTAV